MMDVSVNEKYLVIGTGPLYGKFGGAISVYDIKNQTFLYTKKNIVYRHTVMSVCFDSMDDNYVYFGTYANGENTSEQLNEDAHIVKWDIVNQEVVFDIILEKGVWKASDMCADDKYLYCVSGAGHLKKFDKSTGKELVSNMIDEVCEVELDRYGNLYAISSTANKLYRIDSNTLSSETLFVAKNGLYRLTLDINNDMIYFINGKELCKFDIRYY